MIDWIRNLVNANESVSDELNSDLIQELRRSLRGCEALYVEGSQVCADSCPELLTDGPEKFSELMIDLHRGLMIKIFNSTKLKSMKSMTQRGNATRKTN